MNFAGDAPRVRGDALQPPFIIPAIFSRLFRDICSTSGEPLNAEGLPFKPEYAEASPPPTPPPPSRA